MRKAAELAAKFENLRGGNKMSKKMTSCLWFNKRRPAKQPNSMPPPADSHVGKASALPTETPSGLEGQELTVEFSVRPRFPGPQWRPDVYPQRSGQFHNPQIGHK
jgi:hypothetical protein